MQKGNTRKEVSSSEYLTFEDIFSTWSKKLKTDLDRNDIYLNIFRIKGGLSDSLFMMLEMY